MIALGTDVASSSLRDALNTVAETLLSVPLGCEGNPENADGASSALAGLHRLVAVAGDRR